MFVIHLITTSLIFFSFLFTFHWLLFFCAVTQPEKSVSQFVLTLSYRWKIQRYGTVEVDKAVARVSGTIIFRFVPGTSRLNNQKTNKTLFLIDFCNIVVFPLVFLILKMSGSATHYPLWRASKS